jgi:tRNA threonylcarbamoyl adenosine modification protein YjeE
MGKSVFARGLIQKLTDAEEVPSPTFTLVQGYDAPQFEIYHFDLYRLKDPDEVFELGFEEAVYGGVCLIEWPEKAGNWLPKDIFKLEITPYASGRKITVDVSSEDKIKRLEQI